MKNSYSNKAASARQVTGIACSICLILSLTSCSSFRDDGEKKGEPVSLEKIDREVKLARQWSRKIGSGQGKDYDRLSLGMSDAGVCAASVSGKLACFDHQGEKHWSTDLDERISGGVGVGEGLVLVATANGIVYALDRDSGEQRWTYDIRGLVQAAPQADAGVTVVQTAGGRLVGLDAASGKKLWEHTSDEPILTLRGTATPVIDDDIVYTGFATGKLVAFTLSSGLPRWDSHVAIASGTAEIERIIDIDAAPKVTADAVYAAGFNGNLFAYSKNNGRAQWRIETSTYRELGAGLGKVYLVDEDSRLLAIDQRDGEQHWEQSKLLNRKLSAPTVFSGYLLVADYKGYLHVLSQVDGRLVGRTRVDNSGVRVPMLTHAGQLYIYTDDGKLAVYVLQRVDS